MEPFCRRRGHASKNVIAAVSRGFTLLGLEKARRLSPRETDPRADGVKQMHETAARLFPVALMAVALQSCGSAGAAPVRVAMPQAAGDSIAVRPGDSLVQTTRLVPHRATWRVTRRDPDGGSTVQGHWTDTWARSVEGGRPVFVFRQMFVDTLGVIQADNETVLDATTFRAIRSTQQAPPIGGRVDYSYSGDTASGTLRASATTEPRAFRVVLDEPAWDPIVALTIVVPLERLASGTVVRYPIWNQAGSGGEVTWRHVRLDSMATLAEGGRGAGEMHVTTTVVATPAMIVRLRQTPEPPYFPWFVIERPALTREWTLVHWERFAP